VGVGGSPETAANDEVAAVGGEERCGHSVDGC
jgi:hypothetical protein